MHGREHHAPCGGPSLSRLIGKKVEAMTGNNELRIKCKRAGVLLTALALTIISAAALPLVAGRNMSAKARIEKRSFGTLPDGTAIDLYTLTNRNGVNAQIINYGAIIVSLKTPDRRGQMADIVLGYDDLSGYTGDTFYMGCVVGRYANRIAKGKFKLGGVEYTLARNNNGNHLHGGLRGFDKVVWQARELKGKDPAVQLNYLSKDGEEGYPGNLNVTITYTLTSADELRIDYAATTDKETIVNLTNHSYFNLAGAGAGSILDHQLKIYALKFTPVDETSIPTGELRQVKGTPFDFITRLNTIGGRINQPDEQLRIGRGYDHNYVLNKRGKGLSLAAEAYESTSGRLMQMWTTEPGMQLYTGNYLENVRGKDGKIYNQREGFCLEAGHFPDSPNKPAFPSTVLKPNKRYTQTTLYKFMVKGAKKP
jgi:aldose 1-epimerase